MRWELREREEVRPEGPVIPAWVRWGTVVLPLLFLGLVEWSRHRWPQVFAKEAGEVLLFGMVAVGTVLFSRWVFRTIEAYERRALGSAREAWAQRSRFLAILEASADAIVVVDRNGIVQMANRAAERLLGVRRERLIGKHCHDQILSWTEDGVRVCEVACPLKFPERVREAVECWVPISGRGKSWVEVASGHIFDERGEIDGVVHIYRDLTPRRKAEELKEAFLSMVSHELKTPLNHIKGFASTLLQTDVEWDPATQREFLEVIDREADRLAWLVDNLLEFSRLQAEGKEALRPERIHPQDVLDEALEQMAPSLRDHVLRVRTAPDLPVLWADPLALRRILVNLLDNAAKYSRPGSEIEVEIRREGGALLFQVRDQGIGIPPEEQDRIFDRFYRGRGPTRRTAGTGLGLAICRSLVEAHGGRIWVESAPGQGSTFSFLIPLREGEEEALREEGKVETKMLVEDVEG